ncbi:MAG: hypothetical protein ACXWC8_15615 [Limisphaerales bacterium]
MKTVSSLPDRLVVGGHDNKHQDRIEGFEILVAPANTPLFRLFRLAQWSWRGIMLLICAGVTWRLYNAAKAAIFIDA